MDMTTISGIAGGIGQEALLKADTQLDAAKTSDFAAKLDKASKALQSGNAAPQEDKKLRAACKDMEAVFLGILLKEMRATVPKNSLMGEDSNEYDIVQSMMDSETAKNLAKAGGIGIADMLYKQLSKPQTTTPAAVRKTT